MDIPGYKIERLVAEGGMAAVYLAIQESLDRCVALKLLKKFDKPEQSKRFINEGRIIASLNHRNVITIHDVGIIRGQHYISMEYLEGGDLETRIREGITPSAAINLLKTIGDCLDFVHRRDIVHRDIKPANILFCNDGTPILTDFGIAKQLEQDTRLTRDGTAMGSPYDLSPEQAECKPLDGRTDIYGLGIVFYEMLTGRKPYQGGSYIETVMAHITDPIPSLPPHMERYQELLERMIAKDPEDRFVSAADMIAFINKIGRTTPVEAISAKVVSLVHSLRDSTPTGPNLAQTVEITRDDLAAAPSVAMQKVAGNGLRGLIDNLASSSRDANQRRLMAGLTLVLVAGLVWMLGRAPESLATHNSESEVEQYLFKAKLAMDSDKLSAPAQDNAYLYYQEVIKLVPDHEGARQGLLEIANRYGDLAEQALDRYEYVNAKHYVREGLRVQPENARLVALQQRTNAIKDVSTRLIKGVKSLFE
ncbi:MAG: serine/threonine protein kinase [Gammaproteobacteria bacterium]|nr:serine/threonine protein kinase [Gammaproteobacteria bacterium]